MNEMQAILDAFTLSKQRGETTFLATVVNTQGSTYRRPGARMFISNTGQTVGMISGGCLENDVFQYTQRRMHDDKLVVTYDTTASEDIVWGLGLGCNGIVQVLIERVKPDDRDSLSFIEDCFKTCQPGVLATVFQVTGDCDVKLGAYLSLVSNEMKTWDTNQALEAIAQDAHTAFQKKQSLVTTYELPTGNIQVFLEYIQPPTQIIIFGAGYDAVPMAQLAKSLGFLVTVIDCRANEESYARFRIADEVILTYREAIHKQIVESDAAAVIMTHNYLDDVEILKFLLPKSLPYIGVLGPKRRTAAMLKELQYTQTELEKLHAPLGLDIGADTPEAIALSALAEIQAVISQRSGGFLKYRQGGIHS
jgi:xanthine/CO dehydrogenase XdhC/CoxF family maturation factor